MAEIEIDYKDLYTSLEANDYMARAGVVKKEPGPYYIVIAIPFNDLISAQEVLNEASMRKR